MLIDFHFHLEEGPYSISWLSRTMRAIQRTQLYSTNSGEFESSTIHWMENMVERLAARVKQGSFSYDWLQAYLNTGKQKGIERFGVVDHLYRFREFKPYYEKYMLIDDSPLGRLQRTWLDKVCTSSIDEYLSLATKASEIHEELSFGIEADYFLGGEAELRSYLDAYPFDYVIGSVHFVDGWGFDNPETEQRFQEFDLPALYDRFFHVLMQGIQSGMFDIMAHLDNLKVFNHRPDENILLLYYREVAKALKKGNMASEANTGLWYRYPVKEMCPSVTFLNILQQEGVPLTLSSDAHFPDDIGSHLAEAVELLKQAGYDEIVYFAKKERHTLKI